MKIKIKKVKKSEYIAYKTSVKTEVYETTVTQKGTTVKGDLNERDLLDMYRTIKKALKV